MDRKKGFTLIEMAILIAIVMTLLGLSVTVFRAFRGGTELKETANQIAVLVESGETIARSTGEPVTMVIDVYHQVYWLEDSRGSLLDKRWNAPEGAKLTDVNGLTYADVNDDGTRQEEGEEIRIAFLPAGGINVNFDFAYVDGWDNNDDGTADDVAEKGLSPHMNAECSIHLVPASEPVQGRIDASPETRRKVYTIAVSAYSGKVTVYPYGKNPPWPVTALP